MDWLISTAAAQAAGAPGGGLGGLGFILPMVGIIVVMYFLTIRPQNKQAEAHRKMIAALETGAEIVTSGGILGKVIEVDDQFVMVEIATGVNIKVQRNTIKQILPTGTIKSL